MEIHSEILQQSTSAACMYSSSDLKNYVLLDALADWAEQEGFNQFDKLLGHCKPTLAFKSAIFYHKKCLISFFV